MSRPAPATPRPPAQASLWKRDLEFPTLARAWNEFDVARHKSELYRMWYAGQHAGLPHHTALLTAGDFKRSRPVQRLRSLLLAGTKRRVSLASIIRAQPKLFLPFEAALLELGEESGNLEECLRLLADYFAAEHRMILWIKRKMSYPMFNLIAATFILPFPLLFFGHTGQYLLAVAGGLTLCFSLGGSLLLAAARWYGRRTKFVLGRLCRALALGVEAGLSLDRVVDLAVKAAASPRLAAHVARIPRDVRGGQPLAKTLAGAGLVPQQMLAALEVADTTGNYSDTLKRLADLYDGGYGR
ncbi:MAG: type II secretion system F family protein [Gemmatimonadetes bacterium]|nr:type II secretion system F family protein [Gemmatimonadota bacterium]